MDYEMNGETLLTEDLELIPDRFVGSKHPCFIIAEIGQNHQGSIYTAKQLIETAKKCGADCVKFQKSYAEEKFNKAALARPYESKHSWGKTYGEHKKHLEFSDEVFRELQNYAENVIKIPFTASAMDSTSVQFLESIKVPFIKIGSGDVNNIPLIEKAASTYRPLVISTGMSNMTGVEEIYKTVKKWHTKFILLHCTSAYPAPPNEINLQVISEFKERFSDVHIGYSGHEDGIGISLAAVTLGAKVLERHITLDHNLKGNDHKCSLEPKEFKQMVDQIRMIEAAMGTRAKQVQMCELSCISKLGKTIVAAMHLQKDTVLTPKHVKIKVAEPKGLGPHEYLGKKLTKDVTEDESITIECVEDS